MMKLVHHYYYNNTNHGGSQGNSKGNLMKGEHCYPLMRLFRRRIMWYTGLGDKFFGKGPDSDVEGEIVEEPVEETDPTVAFDENESNHWI